MIKAFLTSASKLPPHRRRQAEAGGAVLSSLQAWEFPVELDNRIP
jgi:hypothetical protein